MSEERNLTRRYAVLSIYWFALELHWATLLGAGLQAQVAFFIEPSFIGRASAVLGAVGAVFSILSQIAAGKASDRLGKRVSFIVAGSVLDVAALFAFALAPSFALVVVAFIAVQISLNIANAPYQALIPDLVPKKQQGRASAMMGVFRLSGTLAGLALARALVKQPGPEVSDRAYHHGLLVLAALVSAVLLVALALSLSAMASSTGVAAKRHAGLEQQQNWHERGSFIALLISRGLISLGLYSVLPFLAFFLRYALHVADYLRFSITLLMLMSACSLIGTFPAGIISDRISKKVLMSFAIALLAAGAWGVAAAHSPRPLYMLAVVLGIGWGAYYSVDWALACNLLPARGAGMLLAVWNIGASAPQVAAPLVGGLLVDRIGGASGDLGAGYRTLFVLVGGFLVSGGAALVFVREVREGMRINAE